MPHGGERTTPPQASSAPSPPSVPVAEGLNLDLVVQFLRGLNVPPAVLAEIQNAVPPPAPKKTAQQIIKEQSCCQLRSKVGITKQQPAKLSKRMEALVEEHTEVAEKVVAKQTELAQFEVELEEARRLIMRPAPPPTPPPSQAPRGHSSPRVSDVASSGMAVDAELLLPSEGEQETFSMQELESIMESFRQRHSLLEQELIASEKRDLEDALGWSG